MKKIFQERRSDEILGKVPVSWKLESHHWIWQDESHQRLHHIYAIPLMTLMRAQPEWVEEKMGSGKGGTVTVGKSVRSFTVIPSQNEQ